LQKQLKGKNYLFWVILSVLNAGVVWQSIVTHIVVARKKEGEREREKENEEKGRGEERRERGKEKRGEESGMCTF
jgi:hypothetical protein